MDIDSSIEMNRDDDSLIGSEKVRGTAVYDSNGSRIGAIEDVMLTKRGGKVAYAVMSFGGFLGIGERFHPLPWDVLDYDTELGGYRVGAEGEGFRDAPNYSRDALETEDWSEETDRYYGDASSGGRYPRTPVPGGLATGVI